MFFPAAMRAFAEWFQPADRSKPVGFMLAGSLIGAILASIIVGWMMAHPVIGWRGAFFVTGVVGFVVALPLFVMTEAPSRNPFLGATERLYLGRLFGGSVSVEKAEPLSRVVGQSSLWILVVARFMTDAVWYTLMFWVNLYLQDKRDFTAPMVASLTWLPPAAADLGAITGGLASSELIRRGWPILKARTTCMFVGACFLPGSLAAFFMPDGSTALILFFFGCAYFGHMFWGTNQLTCHQDLFGARRVATAMGFTGAAGAIGGAVAQYVLGPYVDKIGYLPLFTMTAVLHPIAATIAYVGLSRRKALDTSKGAVDGEAV
jgi:ACS family hexuronate transporter-like MFS transporter